jgi:hypothetical protein
MKLDATIMPLLCPDILDYIKGREDFQSVGEGELPIFELPQ